MSSRERERVLVLGYGNPGRLDDGLGRAAARAIDDLHLPGVTVEEDYQLQIEHAVAVASHDVVVFVDARVDGDGPFTWAPVAPAADAGFTTHALTPAGLLAIARDGLGRVPPAWVLGIRGSCFSDFGERLSAPAVRSLSAALAFLVARLRTRVFGPPGAIPARVPPSPSVGFRKGA